MSEKELEKVEEEAPLDRDQVDRQRLMNYTVKDLKTIAENLGAESATRKADLVNNILAKAKYQEQSETVEPASEEVEESKEPNPIAVEDGGDVSAPSIKHFMATAGISSRMDQGVYDWHDLDAKISSWFQRGYNPVEFQAVGTIPEGHRLLYVFQKSDEPLFKEAHHVVRVLTARPNPAIGSISGFQADIYIGSFLDDGWTLVGARYNGNAEDGIYMAWLLAK